jgi:uncharacterized iron-regulated membrane protein
LPITTKITPAKWRKWHRWLALLVGLQLVIWSTSGVYMVLFELGFIHGNHLVKPTSTPLNAATMKSFDLPALQELHPQINSIEFKSLWLNNRAQTVLEIQRSATKELLNAETLEPIQLNKSDIAAIAQKTYALGDTVTPIRVQLVTDNAPSELNPALLPVWRVDFEDFGNTTLYFDATTGALVTKRHSFWRGFDIMWMLHIMDYENRVDIENRLIKIASVGNLLFLITGLVLIYFSLIKPKLRRRNNRNRRATLHDTSGGPA